MARDRIRIDLESLIEETACFDDQLTERQRNILDAAEKLFGEKGFTDTATAEIARAAGVTERTLFKHFQTKSALLKRVLLPVILRFIAPAQFRQMQDIMEQEYDTYDDFVLAFFRNRIAAVGQHGAKARLLLQELLSNEDFRRQFGVHFSSHVFQPMIRLIEKMQNENKIRADIKPDILVRSQIAMIIGYVVSRLLIAPEKQWDDEEQLKQMVAILTTGVSNKHDAPTN